MGVLLWVHDHFWWMVLAAAACSAAMGWGLWRGRYVPAHAGGPVPERLWPVVGAGSMQYEDERAFIDSGAGFVTWRNAPAAVPGETPPAPVAPDWRGQVEADLNPDTLTELAHEDFTSWEDSPTRPGAVEWPPDQIGRSGSQGTAATAAVALAAAPEPEPVVTVAGRLVETSGEWLQRLERNAAPGWTYAGEMAA
jgi:hypothetical protein